MNKNKMRNFFIIFLVITAVFQTGKLWLDDTDSHNFFHSFLSAITMDGQTAQGGEMSIDPQRVVLGYGNRRFDCVYPSSAYDTVIQQANLVIGQALRSGEELRVSSVDWNSLLEYKLVLYEYPFQVSLMEYAKHYISAVGSGTSGVSSFDRIVVLPARTAMETAKVYFINTQENKVAAYLSSGSKETALLYQTLERPNLSAGTELMYISSGQSGFHIFDEYVFVPQWTGESCSYEALLADNPFTDNGDLLEEELERAVQGLFGGYAFLWTPQEDGSHIFSNENTVVKYNENGILEYYHYSAGDTQREQTLASAYDECMRFMRKDTSLTDRVCLSGISFTAEGLVFGFDYTTQEFPVLFGDELKEELGHSHAVEVVVNNQTVKKYTRYGLQLAATDSEQIETDFSMALDDAMLKNSQQPQQAAEKINGMDLVYCLLPEEQAKLLWKTEIGNDTYYYDTSFVSEESGGETSA